MDEDKRTKTLVILTYSLNNRLADMAYKCATSHREQVNQIIITEDGGGFSRKLKNVADIYIYGRENIGFTKNFNRGCKLSSSDFIIVSNSDVYLKSGNLRDLCTEGQVTCPQVENLPLRYDGFTGSYVCIPKDIWGERGQLDERLRNFESDMDYYERVKDVFRYEPRVIIHHYKGRTLKSMKVDIRPEATLDAKKYRDIIETEYPERKTW